MNTLKTELTIGLDAPVTLLHISDTHLALADERDCERKRELAERRAPSFRRAEEMLQAASQMQKETGHLIIHTGDLLDFVSEANLDRAKAFVTENDVFFAAGNHEFSQYVGEAWEDEAYKAVSMDSVLAAFPEGILFGVRVIHGVKIITLDDNYYYVTPELLARLKEELSDGVPAILAMHNPLFSEDLYAQVMAGKAPDAPPYLLGCPEERLRTLSEKRYNQQKPNDITLEFLHFCESCPNLKAVLAGHLHKFYESRLDSGTPQYVCAASYRGEIIEYTVD